MVVMQGNVHREILEMALHGVGVEKIASAVGIPLAAVTNVLRSPLAIAELARRGA